MTSVSGRVFHPFDLRPEEVDVEDIAHALSNVCRWGGHVKEFYSVAQHSVHVAETLALWGHGPYIQLLGLLHDATEAYMGDIPTPIKRFWPFFEWREEANFDVICQTLIEPRPSAYVLPTAVHQADRTLLATEKRDLTVQNRTHPWTIKTPPLEKTLHPWSPASARGLFLSNYGDLLLKVKSRSAS